MGAQRHDLGAMFVRLGHAMVEAERPVLSGLGVEMWDYVVLAALRRAPARSQARLAETAGRDKTRLIPILDRLERRGLVRRTPDPADRRNRIVELTEAGEELVASCRSAIRRMEARMLADLPEPERAAFVASLERVSDLVLGPNWSASHR
ncbi:MarR family winged helix-turn-helix transcriptional regulator [Pseudonocardia acaciae]|uniref:MarR family winged helix-turn-helix transcriptional regulator n=1 Tax=Pseudonocardia acaciae TaxID=551276 RepID=UPI00056AB73D|nr:MarR family transcriptional regulator [Pseudonocardia acaciae]